MFVWIINSVNNIHEEPPTETASNDLITTDELFVTDFKDALYTALAEGIVNRLGE